MCFLESLLELLPPAALLQLRGETQRVLRSPERDAGVEGWWDGRVEGCRDGGRDALLSHGSSQPEVVGQILRFSQFLVISWAKSLIPPAPVMHSVM